jgi:peptidyl-prolyl cis-trans isomerase SurA
MRRLFVVSMFSLSVAGCAQSRSALTDGTSPKAPVAITPIPSPYDNINTGVGGPAAARMAIKDPSSPQWYGRAQPDGTTTAGQVAGASPTQATAPQPAADRGLTAPAPLTAEMPQTSGPSMGVSPLSASSPSTVARASTGGQVAGGQPAAPPQSAASGLEFIPSQPSGLAPAPAGASSSIGSGPAAGRQSGIPLDSGSVRGQTVPDASAASLTSPLGSQSMPAPAVIPSSDAPKRGRDPLLGPDPDLMPPIPDVSELKPPARAPAGPLSPSATAKPAAGPMSDAISGATAAKPAGDPATGPLSTATAAKPAAAPAAILMPEPPASEPAPAPTPGLDRTPIDLAPAPASSVSPPANPAAKPTSAPGAGAAAAPAPPVTPADLNRSTANSGPAEADRLAALPPLERAPRSSDILSAATARATAPEPASPRRDSQIIRVSALKPVNDGAPEPDPVKKVSNRKRLALEPGIPIAKVGDDIITFRDLAMETKETLARFPELAQAYQSGEDRNGVLQQIIGLRIQTLDNMIDRLIVSQEAKHLIQNNKDNKMLDRVYEDADKIFHDTEVQPLLTKHHLTEAQLVERFVKEGKSLETRKQAFRQLFLSESFLHDKLRDRIKVDLPDLLQYYNAHVITHDFDRPAQITWRELAVEVAKYPNAEAARRKATSWVERLARGEDFAKLARAESDGPARSRNQGGLMQTSPEGYGVAAVNAALKSLPIGQTSGVIAGPESFHVVRVEARRAAGPASFEEVQDKIRPLLADAKYKAERADYIAKLKRRTLVTYYKVEKTKKPRTGNPPPNQPQMALDIKQ